jgi:PAS domain-containing protein
MLWCEPQEPPSVVSCDVEMARRGLRHTLLKNLVLPLALDELKQYLINRRGACIIKARNDLGILTERFRDYSPEVLVSRLPRFDGLSLTEHETLTRRLRALFDDAFPTAVIASLQAAGEDFVGRAEEFWRCCETGAPESEIAAAHEALQETGNRYATRLDALPRGIWLP